ncbi:MAG: preprotein translocase subunit SecE [Chloroflexi bacterium]|nr:preprotein translocase subunit SecE [Chloroflexota bacterium]MBI3764054.1 preprotein translocase subunit SecE [Chloroflexota bacterium]
MKQENVVVRYIRETRVELGKVSWPTRQEALNLTIVVLLVTLTMAIFLGSLDYVFTKLFELIIGA